MAHYIDTSAAAKLVLKEAESTAMRRWLLEETRVLVSSDLTRTELLRAVRRIAPDQAVLARRVLEELTLLTLATSTFEAAAHLDPALLRTLDALHLASALELGDDLEGLVTYDDRMAAAALAHGIPVVVPR
ncbi:type II toxin-antitoxin system VapC family toxin [Agrococcus baldri]|uniref:Ribonuclease VapC n=1 Tax=Agrococcus baldri TaxID=153730 RepID=A0AA87URQ5_9MICO|nr:type II toxin-antitoxin system VapC family toxin [Agrococcus baldri]GEK79710.1 ribonuclease VapC [Agrococcus baldri]